MDARTDLFSFGVVLCEMAIGPLASKSGDSAGIFEAPRRGEAYIAEARASWYTRGFGTSEICRTCASVIAAAGSVAQIIPPKHRKMTM